MNTVSAPHPVPGHVGVFIRPRRPTAPAPMTAEQKLMALFATHAAPATKAPEADVETLRRLLEEARNWMSYWNAGPNPALIARIDAALKGMS